MKLIHTLILAIFTFINCYPAYPHSGRTDANGGHYDHKTGKYHFHNSSESHLTTVSEPINIQGTELWDLITENGLKLHKNKFFTVTGPFYNIEIRDHYIHKGYQMRIKEWGESNTLYPVIRMFVPGSALDGYETGIKGFIEFYLTEETYNKFYRDHKGALPQGDSITLTGVFKGVILPDEVPIYKRTKSDLYALYFWENDTHSPHSKIAREPDEPEPEKPISNEARNTQEPEKLTLTEPKNSILKNTEIGLGLGYKNYSLPSSDEAVRGVFGYGGQSFGASLHANYSIFKISAFLGRTFLNISANESISKISPLTTSGVDLYCTYLLEEFNIELFLQSSLQVHFINKDGVLFENTYIKSGTGLSYEIATKSALIKPYLTIFQCNAKVNISEEFSNLFNNNDSFLGVGIGTTVKLPFFISITADIETPFNRSEIISTLQFNFDL